MLYKVKIDQNGIVTALRKGTVTIAARVGLNVKKCIVNVVEPTLKLNKKEAVVLES